MKISTDHLDQLNIIKQRSQSSDNGQDMGFSKLLDESKNKENASNAPSSVEASALLQQNPLVGMILATQKIGKEADPTKQLEKAFDQMENYAAALGDENKSLKDIAPLADGLKKTASQLDELSRRLPDGDPLKGLASEAAVLATVESMKFNRGDYI